MIHGTAQQQQPAQQPTRKRPDARAVAQWARRNRRVVVIGRDGQRTSLGGVATDTCAGPAPLPVGCFTQQGVLETTIEADAEWNKLWNKDATDKYNTAYNNWVLNDGRRWVNNQWVQTNEPPPPPPKRSTDLDQLRIYEGTGVPDPAGNYQQLPYYVGGGITTVTGPNKVQLPSGTKVYDFGTQAASPALYKTLDYSTIPTLFVNAPIPPAAPPAVVAPTPVVRPPAVTTPTTTPPPAGSNNTTIDFVSGPMMKPPGLTPTTPAGVNPPANLTVTLPDLLPPSGGATGGGIREAISRPTADVLPDAVSDALPSWLGTLPLWQTAAAIAAVYYYMNKGTKGRR